MLQILRCLRKKSWEGEGGGDEENLKFFFARYRMYVQMYFFLRLTDGDINIVQSFPLNLFRKFFFLLLLLLIFR